MRPKLGSPPCSAVLTSGELAIERATGSHGVWPSLHDDPAHPAGALAVGDDLERELAHQRVERLAQAQLVGALGLHPHARGAVREREDSVARGQLTVDRDPVEGALDAHAGEQLERLGLDLGVGLGEAEHRRVARLDHPGALGLGGQPHGPALQLDLQAGVLRPRVARQDRDREVGRVGAERDAGGAHARRPPARAAARCRSRRWTPRPPAPAPPPAPRPPPTASQARCRGRAARRPRSTRPSSRRRRAAGRAGPDARRSPARRRARWR